MSAHPTFETIRACVADSLALDPSDIELGSRLIGDLGADSLDFIDLIFVLEKRYGVKIREGELNFLQKLDVSNPAAIKDGVLTREQVEKLLPWLPALRAVPDQTKVTPGQLFSLITVETLCILVESKLPGG
jgi:acyl carrier protein